MQNVSLKEFSDNHEWVEKFKDLASKNMTDAEASAYFEEFYSIAIDPNKLSIHRKLQGIDAACTVASNERQMGAMVHAVTLISLFLPVLGTVISFIIWFTHKDKSRFVNDQGLIMFNGMLSYSIYYFVCIPLMYIYIGWIFFVPLVIIDIIGTINCAIKASHGKFAQYPLAIKFFKVAT